MATVAAGSSEAQTGDFDNGTGSAIAESVRVEPVSGGLSFGIGVAESLASHQNIIGIAESRSANLGVIGTTLAATPCDGGEPTYPKEDQPQALRAESNGEDPVKEGPDPVVPGVDRRVTATEDPYAEAVTSSANFEVPGVLEVRGVRSTASSGVFDSYREALAITEFGTVVIAGTVRIEGMRWEAVHRTGSEEFQDGTFTIGGATVAGQSIPVDDPIAALAAINEVLRPLGLELRPPTYRLDPTAGGTIATVDSLGIAVIPTPTRDGVLGPLLGEQGVQPLRTSLFNALIEQDCGNASYISILDIVLNAFGAGGFFAIELGGVQATTSEIQAFQGLGELPPLPPLPDLTGPVSPLPSLGGSGSIGSGSPTIGGPAGAVAAPAAPGSAANPLDGDELEEALEAADVTGERGGPLAAVAGVGLLLLLAAAEGDRRKMRRAQREIPMEA